MADPTGMTEEDLMMMLGGLEEEDEGMGMGIPLLAAGGAGLYAGADPYRRELLKALTMGPQKTWGEKIQKPAGRGDVWAGIREGHKERFKEGKWPFTKRGERIAAGRQATVQKLGAGTKAGKSLAKKAGQKAMMGGLTGGAKGLGKLAGGLGTPLGWLFAAMMGYDFLLKPGWNALTKEPRERGEAMAGWGDQFKANAAEANALAQEQSLADQLEAIAHAQATNPQPVSSELKDILQGHYLPPLFAGAQKMEQPSFQQALSMAGGL